MSIISFVRKQVSVALLVITPHYIDLYPEAHSKIHIFITFTKIQPSVLQTYLFMFRVTMSLELTQLQLGKGKVHPGQVVSLSTGHTQMDTHIHT